MSTTTMTLAPVSFVQSLSSPPAPLAATTTTTTNTVEQLYQQSSPNSSNSATNYNNNNNNSNSKTYAFYHFAHSGSSANNNSDTETLYDSEAFHYKGGSYASLPGNDVGRLLLDRSAFNGAGGATTSSAVRALHKSSSYSGTVRPKATVLKQDSVNGRIAISLTDSDNDYASPDIGAATSLATLAGDGHGSYTIAGDGLAEDDAFLVCVPNAVSGSTTSVGGAIAGTAGGGGSATRRSGSAGNVVRTHGKSSTSWCYRAHAFISRNWYLSYLLPISVLLALMLVAYATRDYAQRLLYWIETQNPWVIFALFMLLFIVVSFPVVVGYFVLMITAGYLFGLVKGFLTVCVGANMGIAVAHLTIRSFRHRIPMHKLIRNETGRAILRVISGPRAFKVVLFTRLTPIPFGLQNAIFGVSTINARTYHTATFLGLLPAQAINVYLGSTLRSMHEVLNNPGTAATGYISFGIEVVCGVALMFWVVQKARKELSETLLSDISTEGKLIDIEV